MSTLIVMCGAPASGKTYLAKRFAKTHKNCKIVSRDEIRFSMIKDSDDYFKYEPEVLKRFYGDINAALMVHEYVIADATHLTKKSRNALFRHLNLKNVRVVGFWIESNLNTCLERNEKRKGRKKVPEDVIKDAFRRKVSPQENEPFDDVYFFANNQDCAIGTADPEILSTEETLLKI